MTDEAVTLLVCDDNDAGRYTKVRPLRHAGYRVVEAATGMEALRMMAEHRPALAVMDVKLPDISGLEVTATIKRDYPGTFVLQTSASFVGVEDRVRGLDEGADSYLIQPMEPRELVAGVRALLRIRQAEEDLRTSRAAQRESEGRYRLILESATDFAIITTDLHGAITTWNSGARNIMGWDPAEMLGQQLAYIWTPEDREAGADQAEVETAREHGRAEDQRWHLRKDGSRFWANGLMMTLKDEAGQLVGFLKILRDQTQQRDAEAAARALEEERRQADERLRASEGQFRDLANSIPQLAWMADAEGWIFWYNDRWYEYTGARPEEMEGWGWQAVHDPEVLPRVMEGWSASIASGEAFEMTFPLRAADGSFRPFLTRVAPVRDESGRILRWFGTNTDVAEERRTAEELERRVVERTVELSAANDRLRREIAEREQVEDTLRQAQKMEAVGQLTGGIAHDFNNLLTGITGNLELLKKRMSAGRTDVERYADAAMTAATRAAALTQRLLAFARRQALDPKPVEVNKLVASMEDLLRRTVGEQVAVEVVLAGGLWAAHCDAHQLENALLNLVINARDAMPEGGRVTVETSNGYLDDAYAATQEDVQPGQYVALCVTDTGFGMPAEVVARAFDPFFTTKPIGQGTGLGLSMLYGFVKQSGGHVRIYSEPGQGTTVKLYLPRHRGGAAAASSAEPEVEAPAAEAGETVLVVEDEAMVRLLVLDVLADLNYAALEADDGPSALRILQSDARIDLLVTDVGLPGMNGRQLADRARELRPGLRVLFVTGYAHNAAIGNGLLEPGMEVISKPFPLEALAQKVGAMIEAGRGG